MTSLLLTENDNYNFSNLLANRRAKKLKMEISTLEDEIKLAIEDAGKIFANNGVTTNYIREINELSKEESDIKRSQLERELSEILDGLSLNVKEDIEFLMQKIKNRKEKRLSLQQTLESILEIYPDTFNIDPKATYASIPILTKINEYLTPVAAKEEDTVKEEEQVTVVPEDRKYVTRIFKAPEELLAKYQQSQPVLPSEIVEPQLEIDNSFYGGDIPFEAEPIIPLVSEEIEGEHLSISEEELNATFTDMPFDSQENSGETEEEQSNLEETITYVLEEGNTLASLALLLCGNENGWFDIYEANKALFDEKIKQKGISNMDNIEHNGEIFVGLNIVIPNKYKHVNNTEEYKFAA